MQVTHDARRYNKTEQEEMQGMIDTEMVIIGGGIAGASTAYHLARHGHQVTLLERGEIASEASGVNAGAIGAIGWGTMPDLEAYLTMGSLEIFTQLQLDLGYDIEFRRSGSLQAIHNEAQYAFIRDRVLRLRAHGYTVELLTTREARSIEPELNPALLGCLYAPLRAQADPQKATRALAAAAARHGARILPQHHVTTIQARSDDSYRIETARATFITGTLVLAAGAWCSTIGTCLDLQIPIVPVRGQMWAIAGLPPQVFQTIASAESSWYWHTNPPPDPAIPPALTHQGDRRLTRHLYGRQTRAGDIIFGGDRQLVGNNTTPDPAGIAVNHGHAAEVLPFLSTRPIARTWAGLMPFSLDGAPLIGQLPQYKHLYIVSGLASSGFGRGPMAGKFLADYIHTGHPHPVLSEANPARAVPLVEAVAGTNVYRRQR
jgi:sarcosine oxidase subunit beta